jgi:hypothetical protein
MSLCRWQVARWSFQYTSKSGKYLIGNTYRSKILFSPARCCVSGDKDKEYIFRDFVVKMRASASIGPVCAEKSRVDCNYQQIWLAEASRSGEFSTNIGGERATKR